MTDKLLPCPMCGGRPTMMDIDEGSGISDTQIFCGSCFLGVQRKDDAKAIDAWNKRTLDVVRCGECKHYEDVGCCDLGQFNGERINVHQYCSNAERRANAL